MGRRILAEAFFQNDFRIAIVVVAVVVVIVVAEGHTAAEATV